MSDQIRAQIEDPESHQEIRTARNLPDAANAGQSLEGYASVNGLSDETEIARVAHQLFESRLRDGIEGSADDDWFRAEAEVRRRREALNA